ncbi:hypothetical protein HALLA_18655 [Halostagnicola larsenii XH-48]|uniref:Cohesin domain-containing protein n=1 Tax=Halostagnicola larsenii XH-48 TaxID=797299 RepID=W0JUY6_9EURY|nr:cohesin domain-containing protein [Halostagnicola larsenii]AHG01167.1 hypothetical protein HALLA_18655 [Halostagnicola larsenii XH-48]
MTETRTRVTVVLATLLLAAGLVVAPVSAGHSPGVYSFEPDDASVAAGETVAVDVVLSANRTPAGDGISETGFTVDYDADRFSVVDVEHGSWFEDGDASIDSEINRSSAVDEDVGTVSVETALESPGNGVANSAPVATITFQADEDADDGESELTFANSSAATPSSPTPTITNTGTLEVGEGVLGASGFGPIVALGSLLLAALVGLRRAKND